MSDKSSKTEKPTPKKRKDAREKGQVAQSPELAAWLGMLVVSVLITPTATQVLEVYRQTMAGVADLAANPDLAVAQQLWGRAMRDGLLAVAPLAGALALIGVVASLAQVGVAVTPKALQPKWSRVSPLQGVKRLFSVKSLWEGAKSFIKVAVLGLVAYQTLSKVFPLLVDIDGLTLASGIALVGDAVVDLMRTTAIAGLALAAADYAIQRRTFEKDLRMSLQDIKQEMKNSEGDPHVKGAIRQKQMAMSRNRMLADVATADAVLVNPTHVAVALRYVPGSGAPRVVAKGAGAVAASIRRRAEEHRVPMVRDVALARALHAGCDVGQEVPPELYAAVARVLAFIFSLRKRGASAAGVHQITQRAA